MKILIALTCILVASPALTQTTGGGGGGSRPTSRFSLISMLAGEGTLYRRHVCREGQVLYDPSGGDARFDEICRGGRYIRIHQANRPTPAPSAFRCAPGSGYYDPVAGGNEPRFYKCKDGRFVPR